MLGSLFDGLAQSRKFRTALITLVASGIVWFGGRLGLELTTEDVAPFAATIVGLGLAMMGFTAYEDGKAKGAGMAPIKPVANNGPGAIAVQSPSTTTNVGEVAVEVTPPDPQPDLGGQP